MDSFIAFSGICFVVLGKFQMASNVFKPLAFELIAGASVQTRALAAEVDGPRRIEVGFSPEGSAQKLVLRTIEVASSSIGKPTDFGKIVR